jgi:hypothetical protein
MRVQSKGIHTAITEEESITLDELRMHFPMVRKLYEFCTQKQELFMSRYESNIERSRCMTEECLFRVIASQYFSISRAKTKFPKAMKKFTQQRN